MGRDRPRPRWSRRSIKGPARPGLLRDNEKKLLSLSDLVRPFSLSPFQNGTATCVSWSHGSWWVPLRGSVTDGPVLAATP